MMYFKSNLNAQKMMFLLIASALWLPVMAQNEEYKIPRSGAQRVDWVPETYDYGRPTTMDVTWEITNYLSEPAVIFKVKNLQSVGGYVMYKGKKWTQSELGGTVVNDVGPSITSLKLKADLYCDNRKVRTMTIGYSGFNNGISGAVGKLGDSKEEVLRYLRGECSLKNWRVYEIDFSNKYKVQKATAEWNKKKYGQTIDNDSNTGGNKSGSGSSRTSGGSGLDDAQIKQMEQGVEDVATAIVGLASSGMGFGLYMGGNDEVELIGGQILALGPGLCFLGSMGVSGGQPPYANIGDTYYDEAMVMGANFGYGFGNMDFLIAPYLGISYVIMAPLCKKTGDGDYDYDTIEDVSEIGFSYGVLLLMSNFLFSYGNSSMLSGIAEISFGVQF